MKYCNTLILAISIFLMTLITGCTYKEDTRLNNKNILEKLAIKTTEIKEVVYERPVISFELKNKIYDIVNLMSKDDLKSLNKKYIHSEFGFYNLLKIDGSNNFLEQNMIYNIIQEDMEEISHMISRVDDNSLKLKIIEKDIQFNCSPNNDEFYGWSDHGLFLSSKTDTFLSSFIKEKILLEKDQYKKNHIQKANFIEKTSYKVVLTPDVSFYITKIENNWYITLIDRITTDCSFLENSN